MSSQFIIRPCTPADGPAIAHNNISAFWRDTNWVLLWKGKTMEYVISQSVKRWPWNLIKNPVRNRFEACVDAETGELLGFAYWILPTVESLKKHGIAISEEELLQWWLEAKVPEVEEEEKKRILQQSSEADWAFNHATDVLDAPRDALKRRCEKEKPYLGQSDNLLPEHAH
jgi:hypothetical protein